MKESTTIIRISLADVKTEFDHIHNRPPTRDELNKIAIELSETYWQTISNIIHKVVA